jgi:hypothetical protein
MRIRFLVLTLINAVFVAPALAQGVIDNPGICAQFYPDANCENYGAGNPYTSYGYLETNANAHAPVANRRPLHNRQSTRGLEHGPGSCRSPQLRRHVAATESGARTCAGRFLRRLAPAPLAVAGPRLAACPRAEKDGRSICSADSCITSGAGMQISLWSEAWADCISP